MNKIYFISGVNGVGKTSIMPYLKTLLSSDEYEIHDLDERGVPDNADRNWRISETKHWIREGEKLALENMSTIICGFIKTTDLPELIGKGMIEIVLILLDAKPEIIRRRLEKRYTKDGIFNEAQTVIGKPINKFIDSNVYYVGIMKKEFQELDYPIIDTSDLVPEEVAWKVAEILSKD